jgi:hypothetical protein
MFGGALGMPIRRPNLMPAVDNNPETHHRQPGITLPVNFAGYKTE